MTALSNPSEELRIYFKTASPAGFGLGWGDDVWWGERKGDGAQTVLTPFGITTDPDSNIFPHYAIQIACWHPVQDTAALRALLAHQAIIPLQNSSTAAAGLTLASWTAQTIQIDYTGVVEAIEITGGFLYKGIADLHLINLKLK